MGHKLEHFGISDIGLVRHNNEDVWAELADASFFVLADGMGGHNAGEVAATEAVISICQTVRDYFLSPPLEYLEPEKAQEVLRQAIQDANSWVYHLSEREDHLQGMGTTLCCMMLCEHSLVYAHVGDSRIYRYRNGLEQLTHDHSLRYELIAKGELSEKEAFNFPQRNVITRAIGTSNSVEPEVGITETARGDIYFLCSDGLTDYVTPEEISSLIQKNLSLKQTSLSLVEAAKMRGGNDNITIVMCKIIP